MSLAVIGIISYLIFYIFYYYVKVGKYPKGPTPLPIIGNLHQIPKKKFHEHIDKLKQVYGPCFTLWLPRPVVVFADYEHIKDAFVKNAEIFTYRTQTPPETLLQPHEQTGILGSDGDNWRAQRRVSLKILRDFGMGKNLMEEQVIRSINEMLEQIKSIDDKNDVDMFWPIQLCVGNVINESLFGYHFSYKDSSRFEEFVMIVDQHLRLLSFDKTLFLIQTWPWMRHVPLINRQYKKIVNNIDKYQKFIDEEVSKQEKSFNPDEEADNFVHAYMKLSENDTSGYLDKRNLCANALDFWLAGMETTSNSLRWLLCYMMKYPHIQSKVREEIHQHLGTSRMPSMVDKSNLVYTQAVINESQRHSNMVPFLGSHVSKEKSIVCGKQIPENTWVLAQIWSVMRNNEAFEDPLEFNPDRYLKNDKNIMEKTIPFSIGKRSCAGEGLARMELFLIFTTLMQRYEFVANSPVDLTPDEGAVLTSKRIRCKLIEQF